jgi:putative Mn2+ efflux pump MntP
VNLPSILGIAAALAADAFAVSLAAGMRRQKVDLPLMVRMACVFGGFQFFMPVSGWFMGMQARSSIEAFDHWVAFGLLAFLGGKMIGEGWSGRSKTGGSGAGEDPAGAIVEPCPARTLRRRSGQRPDRRGNAGAFVPQTPRDPDASFAMLLTSGVATSLDALAVGLSLAMLQEDVWFPAAVIGVVCFFFTCAGVYMGSRLRCMPGFRSLGSGADILGGSVLLAVGIKILYEHGVFTVG